MHYGPRGAVGRGCWHGHPLSAGRYLETSVAHLSWLGASSDGESTPQGAKMPIKCPPSTLS